MASSEVLLIHKTISLEAKIFNRKFQSFMGDVNSGQTNCLNLERVGKQLFDTF